MHQMAKSLPPFAEKEARSVVFPRCAMRFEMGQNIAQNSLFTDCVFRTIYEEARASMDHPGCRMVSKSAFIRRFTELANELMEFRGGEICPHGYYYAFKSPYYYFLPSELQKLLDLCEPEQYLFGGTLHGVPDDSIFDGLCNTSAWYMRAKEMEIRQYYKLAIMDGAADFMFTEDGSFGIATAMENCFSEYAYYIIGDEQKVKAFEEWDKRRKRQEI